MARRMAQLKSASISELESVLGHTVTYTSISPSFLNYLEVRDLTIHDSADTGNALLTIHRVRIYYSLVHSPPATRGVAARDTDPEYALRPRPAEGHDGDRSPAEAHGSRRRKAAFTPG